MGAALRRKTFCRLAPLSQLTPLTSRRRLPITPGIRIRFSQRARRNEPYLGSALRKVKSIVDGLKDAGIGSDRIVVCGFSQGACLASEFVASYPQRYAGLIAFTGGLIGPPGTDLARSGDLAGTPVFLGSSDPDPHVPWQRVEETAAVLRAMGAKVTSERYPGMGHTISPAEVELAVRTVFPVYKKAEIG